MYISPQLLHKFVPHFDRLPFNENEYISQLKLDGIVLFCLKTAIVRCAYIVGTRQN